MRGRRGRAPPRGPPRAWPPPQPPHQPPYASQAFAQQQQPPQSFQQQQQQQQQPPPLPPTARASPGEIAAFVEAFRASRSHPSAPPNALTLSAVVQAVCAHFGAASFEEVSGGTSALQFPALRQLQLVAQRVWTFVACFVHSRRVNTLSECHASFLQHEGVRSFADLRLGNSFLHTEAVQTLYHGPVAMPNVSTRDVLTHLQQFETLLGRDVFRRGGAHVELPEFLQYLAQQYRQPRTEAMGVLIDPAGFGLYVGMLRRVGNHEMKELKAIEQEFHKGVADKVFQLTKDKFSVENRRQALDALLSAQQERQQGQGEGHTVSRSRANLPSTAVLASVSSLSLDLLNRVTEVDVYLDNVLRRKAASLERAQREQLNQKQLHWRPISSQAIAETDLKIRNQMTRFLISSPQSKHHSRLKVVTWVLCGIMAKIHALLLSDDKLPAGGGEGDDGKKPSASTRGAEDASDEGEECDCCCVGKDACRCACQCECHAVSDDEKDGVVAVVNPPSQTEQSSKKPADLSTERTMDLASKATASMAELKRELDALLSEHVNAESVQTGRQLLERLVIVETLALQSFGERWPLRDGAEMENGSAKSLLQVLDALGSGEEGNDATEWLQFLDHARLVDEDAAVALSRETDLLPSREAVMEFVAQCQRSISSSASLTSAAVDSRLKWIEQRVCVEFGCTSFEALGVGGLGGVLAALNSSTEPYTKPRSSGATGSNLLKYSNALALTESIGEPLLIQSSEVEAAQSGASDRLRLLTQQAVELVLACPCVVVDVAQFTNWREQFAPALGSLRSFVRSHEMILVDHAARSRPPSLAQTSSLVFVACRNCDLIRLKESASASDLERHARDAAAGSAPVSARFVATTLVSLFVTCGGGDFPLQLVQVHMRSLIAAAVEREGKRGQDGRAACRLALDVLACTPVDFRPLVCDLLQPAVSTSASASASSTVSVFGEMLWRATASDAERAALMMLEQRGALRLSDNQRSAWSTQELGDLVDDAKRAMNKARCGATLRVGDKPTSTDSEPVSANSEAISAFFDSSASTGDGSVDTTTSAPSSAEISSTEGDEESCKAFVETLRRQQFGVGLEIADAAARTVLGIQRQRLERALKRLSDELYSENTHFVLELLQNADDNAYGADVVPSGEFTLTAGNEIVFHNNEAGFSPANIRAICDVGASTKQGDAGSRSIGKKGIGFKSVFKVSDVPEVHSNGFHIRFSAHDEELGGGMGYILPHWVEETDSAASAAWRRRRGTTFVLPLNSGSAQRATEISRSLLAVEPSILLFLHRIRALRVVDQVRNASAQFLKTETRAESAGAHHVVELYSRSTGDAGDRLVTETEELDKKEISKQRWLVVKTQLEVGEAFVDAGRPNETEVAVAVPFDVSTGGEAQEQRPPLQQVFAYLPLRSYGFRFIVQGDFEVPSSREAITIGSEWNQWLISQLPALVAKAVSAFASEALAAGRDPSVWTPGLMALLPLETEVQAPFRAAVVDTMRALRLAHWLPSLTDSKSGSDWTMLRPVDVLDCSEVASQAVESGDDSDSDSDDGRSPVVDPVSDDVLMSVFNKRRLHPAVASAISSSLRRQLQIEQLHCSHVMRLLALSPSKNDVRWTAAVLALLSRLWKRERHAHLLLQELRLVRCFPLEGQSVKWTSLADASDAIYFAPSRGTDQSNGPSSKAAALPNASAFLSELSLLDETFTAQVVETPELRVFLARQVGVKTVDEHDVISSHILPEMEAALASSKSLASVPVSPTRMMELANVLASHVADCGGSQCPLAGDIRAKCCVLTSANSFIRTGSGALETGLAVLMPSVAKELPVLEPWLLRRIETDEESDAPTLAVVSSRYFALSNVSEAAWRALFVDVCRLPELFGRGASATPASALSLAPVLQKIESEKDVHLRVLVSTQLAEFVDRHWLTDVKVSELWETDATASSGEEDAPLTAVWSMWRSHRWLSSSRKTWHRSADLWLRTRATEALFSSEMVPFCAYAWRHERFATDVLGLKSSPSVEDVVQVLVALSKASASSTVDADSVANLYTFLWKQLQDATSDVRDKVSAQFSGSRLLFVGSSEAESSGSTWAGCEDVVWASTAYKGELTALEDVYPASLREFFIRVCGVSRKPSTLFLVRQLPRLSTNMSDAVDSAETSKATRKKLRRRWDRMLSPLLSELAARLSKGSVVKEDARRLKKALKACAWLPVTLVGGASDFVHYVGSSSSDSHLRPAYASSEADRALAKCVAGVASADESGQESSVAIVELDVAKTTDLEPLLELARLPSIAGDVVAHASEWCEALALIAGRFSRDDTSKPARSLQKKLVKLTRAVLSVWSTAFAGDPQALGDAFRSTVQRSRVFPAVSPSSTSPVFVSPAELYLNDQVELGKDAFLNRQGSSPSTLHVLSLYPWGFFISDSETKQTDDGASARDLQRFLADCCGVKSLRFSLSHEVVALGTQRPASLALHSAIRSSLAIAQRVLFHQYRSLYDGLVHGDLQRLVNALKCVVVEGPDALQVVYRVDSTFSHRESASVFWDGDSATLFLSRGAGDDGSDDAQSLFAVLMELTRKLLGASRSAASSVANVLYLASLQRSADERERWLVVTQQVSELPPSEDERQWLAVESSGVDSFQTEDRGTKRSRSDLEDGEVDDDTSDHLAKQQRMVEPTSDGLTPYSHGESRGGDWSALASARAAGAWQGSLSTSTSVAPPLPVAPSSSQLAVPPSTMMGNTLTVEERAAVGRWGEEYVYHQLVEQHRATPELVVTWVNEGDESGLPYDVTVSKAGTGVVVEYVEVKATRTMEKGVFEISMNELDQAAVRGSAYSIYRVFNAGDAARCRVIRMKNPIALVRQKKIQLALVMQ